MLRTDIFRRLLLVFFAWPCLCLATDKPEVVTDSTSFARRVLALTDVILQNHIEPQTRQQLILLGVTALHRADSRPPSRETGLRISQLAGRELFIEYLTELWAEFDNLENSERIFTQGVLQGVPGGALLIDADADRIQGQLAANRYVGVGIALAMHRDENLPMISKVFFDGPAWKAGIRSEDLILQIEGRDTAAKTLQQIVDELRGEDGTDVSVVVRRVGAEDSRNLTMTRGRVFIPSVHGPREESPGQWQYTLDSAPDIAFLRIVSIGASTLHELREAQFKLQSKNINGIILDLRASNGLLHDTIMVAGALMDGGTIGHVQSLDSRKTHRAGPGDLFQGLPLVVLTGRHTSAGNVFLAAALQDNERAVIVGEPTAGETYVRSILRIPGEDDMITLPTAVMQRGDGTRLLIKKSPHHLPVEIASRESDTRQTRPAFVMPDHIIDAQPSQDMEQSATVKKAIEVLRTMARSADPNQPQRET